MAASSPRSGQWQPGTGHLCVSSPGVHSRSGFSSLRASYPLKLLAPSPLPSQPPHLALCYTLAYGGGLVAADAISLSVDVEAGAGLVLLTQGSTKVFKHRPGLRPASHGCGSAAESSVESSVQRSQLTLPRTTAQAPMDRTTRQRLLVRLAPRATLLLLPDSISPFRASRYAQAQRFVLPADGSASLLLLDWVNSGRQAGGEVWSMARYSSTNEVFLGERLVMRERTVLEPAHEGKGAVSHGEVNGDGKVNGDAQVNDNGNGDGQVNGNGNHDGQVNSNEDVAYRDQDGVARKLAPYHVYATLMILGPAVAPMLNYLAQQCSKTSQFQLSTPSTVVWSFSPVPVDGGQGGQGGVVRVAADEVEDARAWLRGVLDRGGIRSLVGDGLWGRII